MNRHFNITAKCNPNIHYMVDTSARIETIISTLVSRGEYFTINRARQYGKTTTLFRLEERLSSDYTPVRMSFEGRDGWFKSFSTFTAVFCSDLKRRLTKKGYTSIAQSLDEAVEEEVPEEILRQRIRRLCEVADKPVVLMIDEVDSATNYDVFITFLATLRDMFHERDDGEPTFHSVILAGVHDIKTLKQKIRPDSKRSYNSPWNIAADFEIDMSFSTEEIVGMLNDYEGDHNTGMDTTAVASQIHYYTNGYPFLVSRLCKTIDETPLEWSVHGVDEAETKLLSGENALFDSMYKSVLNNSEFKTLLESILLRGATVGYDSGNPVIKMGTMYGILTNEDGKVSISNIIFETKITNTLISLSSMSELIEKYAQKSLFVQDRKLDMDLLANRFSAFMKAEYRDEDGVFIENNARLILLGFIRGVVNGTGHYSVEPRTRNDRRMDLVVFYGSDKFVIELKIWHGEKYEAKGYDQIADYLDSQGEKKGWIFSFASTKSSPKKDRIFEHKGFTINETVIAYRAKDDDPD